MTLIFLLLSAIALLFFLRRRPFSERLAIFSHGAGRNELLLMIWIFVLAGAFAQLARGMGAIDATVRLALCPQGGLYTEPSLTVLLVGVFVAACLVSLSIGTSVGTIVALAPIAAGLAEQTGSPAVLLVGAAVGGSFFGDNLSIISDTTVAATRTQGCAMRDKFRANFPIAGVAALLTVVLYVIFGAMQPTTEATAWQTDTAGMAAWAMGLKMLPYVAVLVLALCGVDVILVLALGILLCATIGLCDGSYSFGTMIEAACAGISGMGDLILISLLAGGLLEVIRRGGGITRVLWFMTRRVSSRRGAEVGLICLVAVTNLCTANNTVAILSVGSLARDVARRYGIAPRRAASLLDTASCVAQGLIPYGAQVLMAAGLAALSPVDLIPWLWYPMALGVVMICSILLKK